MQNLIGMTAILMTLLISVPSPLVSGGENQFKELLDRNGIEEHFNSHDFQSAIRSGSRLGALAQENSTIGDPAKSYGFAAKSEEAKFFIIGALYSEALAYLHGRKMNLAAKRLESIETEFINLGVPSSLYNLISKTRNVVETERYPAELTGEVLSLFQPFFEDYA